MNESIVFTECFNCGEVAKVSIESFLKFHDREVHVFGSSEDFNQLGELVTHKNVTLIAYNDLSGKFQRGHEATAYIFATAYQRWKGQKVLRFDSDVIFLSESVSLIENAFDEGFDIVGSRRCYGNNPSGIKGLEKYPDTISTYFLGLNTAKYPPYDFDTLCRMWQGAYSPEGIPILDFGCPVIQSMLSNGATIKYLDQNLIGGQNEQGKKISDHKANLHMDFGSYLIHLGGVGSGCAVYNGKSSPEKSYADWAVIRYAFFCKLFFNKDILHDGKPPIFDEDGRWVGNSWNDEILQTIKKDLFV